MQLYILCEPSTNARRHAHLPAVLFADFLHRQDVFILFFVLFLKLHDDKLC